jgi:DNA-binding MarR family transcriptional regulator
MKQKRIAASELEAMSLRNWPELATKSTGIVWRLNRATNRLHGILDAKIAERGIQPGDFEVLVVLRIFGPPFELSPTAIYRAKLCSSGGLTKILSRLEHAGLIERRPNSDDKRSELVHLTPRGKRMVEAAMGGVIQFEKEILGHFSAREKDQLAKLLNKLLAKIECEE